MTNQQSNFSLYAEKTSISVDPEKITKEIICNSPSILRSSIIDVALEAFKDSGTSVQGLRLFANYTTGTNIILDTLINWNSEGGLQATATATISGLAGIKTYSIVLEGLTAIGGLSAGATIAGSIAIAAVLNFFIGHVVDYTYDFFECKIHNMHYDESNKILQFETDLDKEDIKKLSQTFAEELDTNKNLELKSINIIQTTDSGNNIYSLETSARLVDFADKYNMTQEELEANNSWMNNAYSNDKSYLLINENEQFYIPEEVLRGSVNYTESFETVKDIFEGTLKPSDLIDYQIPEGSDFFVPTGGDVKDITYQYTQAPVVDAKALTIQALIGLRENIIRLDFRKVYKSIA